MNPAEKASEESLTAIFDAIERGQNFLLEAGAGAGKTYSLVKALQYLIEKKGVDLLRNNQQVACITYTNIASDEIKSRTDGHPAVLSSTIHAFCWSLIRDFQSVLREQLPTNPKWVERLAEAKVAEIGSRRIDYELGYPSIKEKSVLLSHNDVIALTAALMEKPKFRDLFASRHPILFIDEYQDTNEKFAEAIKTHLLGAGKPPLVGFFGDHWQKIYGDGCGRIEHPSLKVIGKGANFRSAPIIVDVLNRMRPELKQAPKDPKGPGSIAVYHTNDWTGMRRTDGHWKGDLPPEESHKHLEVLMKTLTKDGWDFDPSKTKILMLTHNVLAREQGYSGIVEALDGRSERFFKKEDLHIKFLVETIEPACAAYEGKRFGELFDVLGGGPPAISSHADKASWAKDFDVLMKLRDTGTIGAVIDHVRKAKRPGLPEEVERKEARLSRPAAELKPEEVESVERLRALRNVPYREVISLAHFIDEKTPFATKHGVKGAEFENVLVVVGRGWNMYDFNQLLEWAGTGIPVDKQDSFERNRNLFYVACSRPKKRLALFFTQKLSIQAMATLDKWFGAATIHTVVIS